MTVNEESLGFGLSFGQKKQFEDVTLGSGSIFLVFMGFRRQFVFISSFHLV